MNGAVVNLVPAVEDLTNVVRRERTVRLLRRAKESIETWFAHDVHTRGIPAVVIIPPMEARPCTAALTEIAACLTSPELLTVRRLMRAARRIRSRILGLTDLRTADRSELASDVCLYCPDDWRLREITSAHHR